MEYISSLSSTNMSRIIDMKLTNMLYCSEWYSIQHSHLSKF